MSNRFKNSPPKSPVPDYSHVDSIEKAEKLADSGELTKLYLLPANFGGADVPHNIVYVPAAVVDLKYGIDSNTIQPLVEQGKVRKYVASPQYEGKSIVPSSIEIHASDPANFRATIRIWGQALTEPGSDAV